MEFLGWQIQRGTGRHKAAKPSVEECIVNAIQNLSGQQVVKVIASGRTDAGVHASGQVAHFTLDDITIPEEHLLPGVNNLLPDSIRIHGLQRVPDDFMANRAARKQYSYYFLQGPCHLPHLRSYTMWNRRPLNGELMNEAIQKLIGEHDFYSFSSKGASVTTTVRTIFEAEVKRQEIAQPAVFDPESQYLWRMRILGSGFLKQMVRGIAGTLKQIGEERRSVGDIGKLLESHSREKAGPTALARGLWLDRVWYAERDGIDFLPQC